MRNEEFERLYANYAQPLFSFLVYRTGDQLLAEDLLADTFERVLRAGWRFDRRKASEKTWLYTIALNLLRDHARKAGAAQRAVNKVVAGAREPRTDGEFDQIADRDAIHRALHALSAEERETIALRFGADLTMPEIAMLTKEKLTTVEARVYRALRKMRSTLEE
jgi:RNA polymerase sigma-70 factor (ECF subfamily)